MRENPDPELGCARDDRGPPASVNSSACRLGGGPAIGRPVIAATSTTREFMATPAEILRVTRSIEDRKRDVNTCFVRELARVTPFGIRPVRAAMTEPSNLA
jgi:hypothetical protein